MNQQVNLYLPEFRRKRDWMDFQGMLRTAGLTLLLLFLFSGLQYWSLSQKQSQLTALHEQLGAETRRTRALEQSLGGQNLEQELLHEVELLQARLQESKLLLNFLQAQGQQNNTGLSRYLVELARFRIEGVRLTQVQLRDGGNHILLNGQVQQAQNVPMFLQNLSHGNAFADKRFVTLNINQIEGPPAALLSFLVTTDTGGDE